MVRRLGDVNGKAETGRVHIRPGEALENVQTPKLKGGEQTIFSGDPWKLGGNVPAAATSELFNLHLLSTFAPVMGPHHAFNE